MDVKYDHHQLSEEEIWIHENHASDVRLALKGKILASERSPYQTMVVAENRTLGRFFTLNNFLQVTEADEFIYHEMIVHPALAVNPALRRVLIIGGGDGGTAREICRYPGIEQIDLVEIDEMVVRLCREHLPQTAAVFANPRLNLIIGDGLEHMANVPDDSYDLILVDSTDPIGPGEGLFSLDFYRHCHRVLHRDGIMINQLEGAFYAGDFHEMSRAYVKLKEVFPIARVFGFNMPTYASGYWYFGFASKKFDPLRDQQAAAWEKFNIDTRYYNSDIHCAAFALPNYVRHKLAASLGDQ